MSDQAAREQHAELRGALDVLARRFAEEEASWEAAGRFPPVTIAYSHNGYKITVERSK